jgi:hypothetical protein
MEPRHIPGKVMNGCLKEQELEARNVVGGIIFFGRRMKQARRAKS